MRNSRLSITLLLGVLGISAPAAAQQTVSDALTFLVTNQSVDTGSVQRDVAAAQSTSSTISRALLANLATLPVTSTSGAFAYRLNPDIGTVERSTSTFGPVFVDRALTTGAGGAAIGLTFQHFHFTALDGRNLRDADVATVYGNVGLGNRIDVGAAVPVVWLRMDGTRVNTYRGRQFTQASASARAVGVADMLLRAKGTVYEEDGASVAAAVDLRLPTGREEDLLGTGKRSVRLSAIGSLEGAHASAHANLGVVFGGLADEIDYGLAFSSAATARLTFGVEAVGRWKPFGCCRAHRASRRSRLRQR
jgi:hypothetical protein